MTSLRRFQPGTVALVTGASSGIGLATAKALLDEGYRVVLAARRIERLSKIAAKLGDSAFPLELDVKDADAVAGLIDGLPAPFKQIDILVNNAGHAIGGIGPFSGEQAATWADMIETNVQGLLRVTHAIIGGMMKRGAGDIVNLGSVAGIRTLSQRAAYGASKAAVHTFSDNLRVELAGSGVRIIEILPGLTRTEFSLTRLRGDKAAADQFLTSIGEPLDSADVARAILFALHQPARVSIAEIVIVPSERV